jgi:hypothetical protein
VFRVGNVTYTPTANANSAGPYQTFSSPYSGNVVLAVSKRTSVPYHYTTASGSGLSTTGFTPYVWRRNTTNVIVDWMACGPRPGFRAAREQEARYLDEGQYGFYVQVPGLKQIHEFVEALHKDLREDGSLRLYAADWALAKEYGPGEWSGVQREWIPGLGG